MMAPSSIVVVVVWLLLSPICTVSLAPSPLTNKGHERTTTHSWTSTSREGRKSAAAAGVLGRRRSTALDYRVKDSLPPQERNGRWRSSKSAEIVEHELSRALESLVALTSLERRQRSTTTTTKQASRRAAAAPSSSSSSSSEMTITSGQRTTMPTISLHLFPTVRECNSAIAKLGDEREFLRALRMFGKMRKAASLQSTMTTMTTTSSNKRARLIVPAPTLVTYSTLMSRFVKADKPLVALRLWTIMKSSDIQEPVDVKACNILMNCYAKLADVASAKRLLDDMEQSVSSTSLLSSSTPNSNGNEDHDRHVEGGDAFPLPNLVTYNTFLTACQNAGDMDSAVDVFARISSPDTLSYTALIATVGRRASRTVGQYDPSPAFDLLDQMIESNVDANGKTFSALIDACGRCRRSDLALQGLRIMLRYKKNRQIASLPDEVGAWTAAISACGRNERLDAAIQLFYTMPKFGVEPNIITCGSLVDSLLRAGRTAETLMVLKFMKKNGLPVTEVMYTSLLQRAEKLAHLETGKPQHKLRQAKWYQLDDDQNASSLDDDEAKTMEKENGKAIEIYTSLIESLSGKDKNGSNSTSLLLMKAFLLFQEMAGTDIMIDMPCYHAILRVCAQARDVGRAQDVLQQMIEQHLVPTDSTWKLLLLSAASDPVAAESIWKRAMVTAHEGGERWTPSVSSLQALLASYHAAGETAKIAKVYRDIVEQRNGLGMGMDRIVQAHIETSSKVMIIFHEACKIHATALADNISRLECLRFLPDGGYEYPSEG